jgi:tRNA(Arg) A34 adenosine deaminase TadA
MGTSLDYAVLVGGRKKNEVIALHMNFTIRIPDWVAELLARSPKVFQTREDRMRFVIGLARENVKRQTGGPFGAGVFDANGRLVAPGVNIVATRNCSILHAEMVAIALAQKNLGRYNISDNGKSDYELVASTEPCAMCFGAIPWSGVTRLVCGARDEDARCIGFDEGPKLPDWQQALEERGIQVSQDVLRQEAVDVLDYYVKTGGAIYNARGHSEAE